ncbi:MAG: lipopolysaccharide biosynthesis protein [Hyphomonadaceae bacterium]|nr:lipopolysaccharide biosynthesis protein [Hyphomonadaceae bacterium]
MALRKLAFSAAALSAARATQTILTFLALPFLARLLGPAEYGLVALAMSFVLFTMAFSDAGMGQSLVRTPPENTVVWSSAFWMIAALSGSLGLLLVAVAWPAAWVFEEPRLAALVLALAPLPLLQGMLSPAMADLQQREKFNTMALAEIVGALAGVALALYIAFSGGGAWALVTQQLGYWGAKGVILVASTRFRPRFVFRLAELSDHFRFGRDTAAWGLINFFARQIDPLVIAKIIGTISLGFYAMAMRLMSLPAFLVSGPVQSTLYTRMVALRDDKPALRTLVLIATRALAAFVFPPMAILCVASAAFIEIFLGERWLPTAILFAVLAPTGALQAVVDLNGGLLMAVGRTDLRLRLTWEFTLLWVIAVPFLAMQGVEAVAIGYSALFLLYLPRTLQLFLRPIDLSLRDYFGALSVPLVIACALAAIHVIAGTMLPLSPWGEIALAASEILIGYGVSAWVLRGRLTKDLKTARGLFKPRVPQVVMPDPTGALQK